MPEKLKSFRMRWTQENLGANEILFLFRENLNMYILYCVLIYSTDLPHAQSPRAVEYTNSFSTER